MRTAGVGFIDDIEFICDLEINGKQNKRGNDSYIKNHIRVKSIKYCEVTL
jgi:hypothetical protein